jgi:hypothetical protein
MMLMFIYTMQNKQPIPTFADFEATSKGFSDGFIENALNETLESAPGDKALFVKAYMDKIPADASDLAFAGDEAAVQKFRTGLADFIGSNLKIWVGSDAQQSTRETIRTVKDAYVAKLESDKPLVADWVHGWRAGTRPKMPQSAFGFHGLNVLAGGKVVDLTDSKLPNAQANIFIQRSIGGQYVRWSSSNYLKARATHQSVELTRRIYLNPTIASSVDIFQQVVTAADQRGLTVKGKILDRTADFMKTEAPKSLRGDGIVLAATEGDANALMEIVAEVQKANYETAFKGRKVSRIPLKVGDGVAVGDEPHNGSEESLSSGRSTAIEHVLQTIRDRLGIVRGERIKDDITRQRAIKAFRTVWPSAAKAAGINPDNMAFNYHQK